ncbi:MAG TPA: YicC family protein [Rectinema sp.]|nr:YicC family protein [Rectinema sp.]
MKSMTGFAHSPILEKEFQGTLTLKSFNNRFLDISIFLPSYASRIEPLIRDFLGSRILRGKVECTFKLRKIKFSPEDIELQFQAATLLSEQLRKLAEACGIEKDLSLDLITKFPGIVDMNTEIEEDYLWPVLMPILEETWLKFEESRIREGTATEENIRGQLQRLKSKLIEIELQADSLERMVYDQLVARFKELLSESYDEGRVLQEVAVQLVRLTINEEIGRLRAHIDAFELMAKEPACGKKLDFLCQEMNREINTIGSKSMLVSVSHAVVEMKDALENIREQLRNVE